MNENAIINDQQAATRSEIQLLERAVRMGWPLPDEIIDGLASRMWALVCGPDKRIAVRAAAILVAMNNSNPLPMGQGETSAAQVIVYLPDNGRG